MRRQVLYDEGPDGTPSVTGLKLTKAGQEQIATADAYIAALDVPGELSLIAVACFKAAGAVSSLVHKCQPISDGSRLRCIIQVPSG